VTTFGPAGTLRHLADVLERHPRL